MSVDIVVVDDEKPIADLVELYLQNEGYTIHKFYTGREAIDYIQSGHTDLAVLDLMLPDVDGFTICKTIREKFYFPIIMLTAKVEDVDKIMGLTIGADDYITKPFNPLELVARVNSQMRRYTRFSGAEETEHVYSTGGLFINDDLKEVTVDGQVVKMTPLEYNILLLLVKNQGKVFSISQIYESIWNEDAIGADNTVAVHIRHIREKIEINPKEPRYLKVVWGVGYKVEKLG